MNGTILTLLSLLAVSGQGEFSAGVARKVITPVGPVWMSGFAARTHASEGVVHDLWAKAIAFQDAQGERVVIVTTDLIGLPRDLAEEVAARVKEKCGLERRQLLLSSSHTHSGPIVWGNLTIMFSGTADERQKLVDYRNWLAGELVALVEAALADLSPATLAVGHGSANFAVNRRQQMGDKYRFGVNPNGPVDHDIPIVYVTAPDGRLRAVLFGYACHNTTLLGDRYLINGDYAGYAQIEIEKAMPGTTAMFAILCGADQNANPRGTPELAARYGKMLADEVQRVLAAKPEPLLPAIRTAYEDVNVDLAHQERSVFEAEAMGDDRFRKRRAELVLAAMDAGTQAWQVPVPVQVVRFSEKLAIVALGGEVVVDYSLRLKRECPGIDLIVAGYTNNVMCYIPSRRVLSEGGYEPLDSMIYYGQPGPLVDSVEEILVNACHRLLSKVAAGSGN